MSPDEFRDYILGFIFYKYLSERMHQYADGILAEDGIKFDAIDEASDVANEEDPDTNGFLDGLIAYQDKVGLYLLNAINRPRNY